MTGVDQKGCSRCGVVKPLDEFNRHSKRVDGRQAHCRDCSRMYHSDKADHFKERNREYRRANADKISARGAARYAANRERLRAQNRDHALRNREEIRASRMSRPHVQWANAYRHRARVLGMELIEEPFTKDDVVDRYGDACFYCSGPFDHLDHYVPISHGGPHTLDNARPACTSCNGAKGSMDPVEWARVSMHLIDIRLAVSEVGRVGEAANGRRRTPEETASEVARLVDVGVPTVEIVKRMKRRSCTISRALYKAGRRDLARPFTALAELEKRWMGSAERSTEHDVRLEKVLDRAAQWDS